MDLTIKPSLRSAVERVEIARSKREIWMAERKKNKISKRKLPDNRPYCPQCSCLYQYDRNLGYHCERCNKYDNDILNTLHDKFTFKCLNFEMCGKQIITKNKHNKLCHKCKENLKKDYGDMGWLSGSDYF